MALYGDKFNDILKESKTQLQRNTNITRFSAGAKAQAMLLCTNRQLNKSYNIITQDLAQAYIRGATGQFLDYIGEVVGIRRGGASGAFVDRASQNLKFYVDAGTFSSINSTQPIFIEKGTRIFSDPDENGDSIEYAVADDYFIPPNTDYYFVSATATIIGSLQNVGAHVLTNHDVVTYAAVESNLLKVTNTAAIDNGEEIESDDQYRYRLLHGRQAGYSSNEMAIRLSALSTPGVADVVMNWWNRGIGTGDVIILSTTGYVSNALVQAVTDNIYNYDHAVGFGADILVRKPREVGVSIDLSIEYQEGVSDDKKLETERQYKTNFRNFFIRKGLGDGMIFNRMISLFPLYDGVKTIGQPNTPIDAIYTYRSYENDESIRTRSELMGDLEIREDEKLTPEQSVIQPLNIIRA